ncbi:MAG: hypothetical protein ACRDKY_04030, partial [Solirubrobacteraceae bacterium]
VPPPPPPPPPAPPTGSGADLPPIDVGMSATFLLSPRGTKISRLTVRDIPGGSKLRLRCKSPKVRPVGARCPFARVTLSIISDTAKIALAKRFKRRRLAPKTTIRIYVTAPGRVGSATRFTLRRNKPPLRFGGCVDPALKRVPC